MFLPPTHFPMNTQWWSNSTTQQLHIVQCLVPGSTYIEHLVQNRVFC